MGHDLRDADHLPRSRGDGGAHPYDLPRQRRGTTPQMHGRYPDYDVLENARHWDEVTRRVVLDRVEHVPDFQYFEAHEIPTLETFCDLVTDQDKEPRIAVLHYVDEKLAKERGDGYRYVDMPPQGRVWQLVAVGLDEAARDRGAESFALLDLMGSREIVDAFCAGNLDGDVWGECNQQRAWEAVTGQIVSAFYAHPWSWNEIGFGGPAYPRGYARIGMDMAEAWEGVETDEAIARPRTNQPEDGT